MRMTVSPSVDGTTSATTPTPQSSQAPIITVVRTAEDRPSSASPMDHAPATPTASHSTRGPHDPVSAASRRDPLECMTPRLADRPAVDQRPTAWFGSFAGHREWNDVAEEVIWGESSAATKWHRHRDRQPSSPRRSGGSGVRVVDARATGDPDVAEAFARRGNDPAGSGRPRRHHRRPIRQHRIRRDQLRSRRPCRHRPPTRCVRWLAGVPRGRCRSPCSGEVAVRRPGHPRSRARARRARQRRRVRGVGARCSLPRSPVGRSCCRGPCRDVARSCSSTNRRSTS